jgi:hypothetical protein
MAIAKILFGHPYLRLFPVLGALLAMPAATSAWADDMTG